MCYSLGFRRSTGYQGVQVTGIASTIYNSLLAYYRLEEATGTRIDSVAGAYNLTASNNPGNTTGKIGNAIQLVTASSQWLDSGAVTLPVGASDFSTAGWVYLDTLGTNPVMIDVNGASPWVLTYIAAVSRFRVNINGATTATANTFGAPATATWYFIATRYTTATKLTEISINGGVFDSAVAVAAPMTGVLSLGATSTGSRPWNGRLDETGIWTRLLADVEIAYLYNSGTGLTLYP